MLFSYFAKEATREILDELIPLMCPFDLRTIEETMDLLTMFLPTSLPIELSHIGHELWFKNLMDLWDNSNYEHFWGMVIIITLL